MSETKIERLSSECHQMSTSFRIRQDEKNPATATAKAVFTEKVSLG